MGNGCATDNPSRNGPRGLVAGGPPRRRPALHRTHRHSDDLAEPAKASGDGPGRHAQRTSRASAQPCAPTSGRSPRKSNSNTSPHHRRSCNHGDPMGTKRDDHLASACADAELYSRCYGPTMHLSVRLAAVYVFLDRRSRGATSPSTSAPISEPNSAPTNPTGFSIWEAGKASHAWLSR